MLLCFCVIVFCFCYSYYGIFYETFEKMINIIFVFKKYFFVEEIMRGTKKDVKKEIKISII